jgi:hypothetical protein
MRLTICARAFVVLFAWTLAAQAGAQVIGTTGQEALETARSGTVFTWRNPDDGTSGSFIPRPAFQDAAGRICRAFDQTVMIGGQMQQAQGTACRQSDGWWELRSAAVDGPPPAPRFVPAPVIVHAPPPIIYDYRPIHYALSAPLSSFVGPDPGRPASSPPASSPPASPSPLVKRSVRGIALGLPKTICARRYASGVAISIAAGR